MPSVEPVSAITDPSAASSLVAVERALEWYSALGPQRQISFLPREATEALRQALSQRQRWDSMAFEALIFFGHVMHKLAGEGLGAPRCTVGDAVTAHAASFLPDEPWSWDWEPVVDDDVLARLAIRETSTGIVENRRQNREGWWHHAERNHAFIRKAAASLEQRRRAVILGAGHAFDLPLGELARTFESLVLVDIDGDALAATIAHAFPEPEVRARVEGRVVDVTGINRRLLDRIDALVAAPGSAEEVAARIATLCRSVQLPDGPRFLAPGERADLIVSSCVLSQIAWPQCRYARARYEQRFGPLPPEAARLWSLPWHEFELRVQQEHVNALAASGTLAVLTSDVANRATVRDATGTVREANRPLFLLSVEALSERVPQFMEIERHASWSWNHTRLTPKNPRGSSYDVEGLVLRTVPAA